MRDVFQVTIDAGFPNEARLHDFDNQYETLGVSSDFASSLQVAAEATSTHVVANLPALLACDRTKTGDAGCGAQFIDAYARRIYRRPPSSTEREVLASLFGTLRISQSYNAAIAGVVEAMVQSPQFLFRTEFGDAPSDGTKTIVPLTHYEVASALSYALWQSAPDPMLLDAAEAGHLGTRAEIQAQAKRLLQDQRAHDALGSFFVQWLDLDDPEALRKPDPASTSTLASAMVGESRGVFDKIVWSGGGKIGDLFTADWTLANAELGRLYDLTVQGNALTVTKLPTDRRSGVLTQPGFIAAQSPGDSFSPVFLGRAVRVALFCQTLPPPPPGVPAITTSTAQTTRQRYAQHASDASCAGCHRLMDPIGFGFENFDVLGRYRTTEAGAPLSGDGSLVGTDVDGDFTGVVALGRRLASSNGVATCVGAQMLKFMLGRDMTAAASRLDVDAAALSSAVGTSRPTDLAFADVATSLVASDAFLFRDAAGLLEK